MTTEKEFYLSEAVRTRERTATAAELRCDPQLAAPLAENEKAASPQGSRWRPTCIADQRVQFLLPTMLLE